MKWFYINLDSELVSSGSLSLSDLGVRSEPVGGKPCERTFTSFSKYACLYGGSNRWSCDLTFNWSSLSVRNHFYINLGLILFSTGSLSLSDLAGSLGTSWRETLWAYIYLFFSKYACLYGGSKRWSCDLTFNWSSLSVSNHFYINLGSILVTTWSPQGLWFGWRWCIPTVLK